MRFWGRFWIGVEGKDLTSHIVEAPFRVDEHEIPVKISRGEPGQVGAVVVND